MSETGGVLIGGVGYADLRDHSVGPVLAERLAREEWPDGVEVENLSYGPVAVYHRLDTAEPPFRRLVLVGAVGRGRAPGSVTAYRWDGDLPGADEIQGRVNEAVTGVVGLDNLVIVVGALGAAPEEVYLVEIEPRIEAVGEALGPEVERAADEAAHRVRELALHAGPGEPPGIAEAPLGGPPAAVHPVERLNAALDLLGEHPDREVRAAAAELVGGLRLLHGEALERLLELVSEDSERFQRALADPVVANVLLLYDLVVIDERSRSLEALEAAAPALDALGVRAELVGVEEGVVSVRLLGASDEETLGRALDAVDRSLVERLPGYRGLKRPEEARPRAGGAPVSIVPLDSLRKLARKRGERQEEGS